MGVRYNAEKKKVGNYYSTAIYSFRCKCHLCDGWFEIQTDPKVRTISVGSFRWRSNTKLSRIPAMSLSLAPGRRTRTGTQRRTEALPYTVRTSEEDTHTHLPVYSRYRDRECPRRPPRRSGKNNLGAEPPDAGPVTASRVPAVGLRSVQRRSLYTLVENQEAV